MTLRLPKLRILLLGLLAALAVFLAVRAFLGKPVATVAAERGNLIESVIATGRVITPARVALGSQIAGTLAEIKVKEGDRIQAGQTLARLIANEQAAALEQAERSIAEAEARLIQLDRVGLPVAQQALRQAEAGLKLARQEFDRVKRLVESGFYSPSRLDEAQRTLDSAQAGVQAAAAQSASNARDGADARVLHTRLAQARAARAFAQAKLDQTRILAPSDGILLTRLAEPGDVVTAGRKLFDLAVAGERQIVLDVDEKNLGRLTLNQTAQAVADAYPGQPFAARLFYIAPGVDAAKGSVEVKLVIPQPPAFVKPDMTVSVEIETARKSDVLTLPDRLVRDATTAPWVLAAEQGRAVKRAVKLGVRGQGRVEIAAGLKAGERVIAPETGVKEGARVR
ncbi:MAG: efflux RND transporter periplasmic adaptor subunit [Betaproteobacteria bacterium]|nr:efflux RND transporter periplasmic adaptor subunit [Betaproteobacteria bacterium]